MSGRDSVLISKLKDGIQEIIVFLRMLEGAKLSPVYDRKRRQLMDKLLDLQGDTRRVAPPNFEGDNEPSLPTSPDRGPDRTDESRRSITSEGEGSESGERTVSHRSSRILDMRGKFEQSSSGRPTYYKTLEQLKKGSPDHKDNGTPTDKGMPEGQQPEENQQSVEKEQEAIEDEKEESFEIPEDTPDAAEPSQDKSQRKGKKDKKHRPAFFKKLLAPKKDKTDSGASPMGSSENLDQNAKEDQENECNSPPSEEQLADEPEEEEVDDKDAPMVAILNRVTKRLGRTSLQQVQVVLEGTSVRITKLTGKDKDKEAMEIDLTTSATAQRDNLHFDIFTTSKTFTFRTESEEQCSQWTTRLMDIIKSCTPDQPEEEEVPSSEQQQQPVTAETPQNATMAPQITVMAEDGNEFQPSSLDGSNTLPTSVSYENVAYDKRRRKTMPEVSACLLRSNFYRKGKFSWDRVWCMLTHDNTLYISSSESSKKPQLVLPIDLQSKVDKKRGTDKHPHGLQLTVGGKRELLASDNEADYLKLLSLLETATGLTDIEELLSEDEGGDLYEDLPDTLDAAVAPQIPSSPRPQQRPLPAPVPVEDDDYDGDIYEGMDDLDITPQAPPALPATEPPKKYYSPSTASHQPSPSLPPRNMDAPAPTLPPRPPSMPAKPQEYEPAMPSPPTSKKKAAPPPVEEEVYDDVIAPVEEETYDDVVAPVMQEEETYDDVVVPVNEPEESYDDVQVGGIMEEFYEEMDTNQGYVAMSKNKKGENVKLAGPDEFYTEMDAPPPRPPPPTSSQRAPFGSSSPSSTPTNSLSRTAAKGSFTPSKPAPPPSVSKAAQPSSPSTKQSSVKGQSPLITRSSTTSTTRPPGVGGPKKLQTTGKVATLSRMFQTEDKQQQQQQPSTPKGSHSGSLLYKTSTKPSFANEWCVLDGSMLQFFSAATDLRSHYKFSLRDAELSLSEKSEMKSGQYGFHLAKSSVVHQFATNSKEELDAWLVALAPVVQKCFPPDGATYQAKEDHTASGEKEISFKSNDLVWVLSQDSADKWTGIASSGENKYAGPCGQFPPAKVRQVLMEDPYI